MKNIVSGRAAGVFYRNLKVALLLGVASAAAIVPAQAQFADSYDLRSAGPGGVAWVPAVQNQSHVTDCWAFATSTALDSNLIVNGYLPTSTVAPDIAISTWHLTAYNGAAQYTAYDSTNTFYSGFVPGNPWMSTSYYTRGQGTWSIPDATTGPGFISTMGGGPVLNSSNTLNPFPLTAVKAEENLAPYLPPVNQTPGFTVTGAYYFDQAGSNRTTAQQVSVVKAALLQYGGLSTYMYAGGYTEDGHDESVFQYDQSLGYEYTYNPSSNPMDHVVTIIGWNDNIVIPTGPGTSVTGAWIVQNSWGAWGGTLAQDDGTFYASYSDPFIGVQGVTAFTAVPSGKYSPIVMQNELGPTYATGNSTSGYPNTQNARPTGMGYVNSSRTTQAVTTLTATETSQLIALGITSLDAQAGSPKTITISIYDTYSIIDGIATPGTLLATQEVSIQQLGYQAFDLDTPINLTNGQTIAVLVNYNGSDVPYVWQSASINGQAAPIGLTYFYDLTTGEWQDFGTYVGSGGNDDYTGVFSVKGLMAVPEPGTWALLALGLGAVVLARRRTSIA